MPRTARPKKRNPRAKAPASPLDGLLAALADEADDPRVRAWAEKLIAGDAAEGEARPKRARRKTQ
ncbi:unnamed protein product [Gemmataceae bacterium]|nr:unnamed protein product [Gemmataceae bacterium]VTU02451.1 unnamed protein product [Gemmataceae bacterium]